MIWCKEIRNTKQWALFAREQSFYTRNEKKKKIEKRSNLLNQRINIYFHIGLDWLASLLAQYRVGLG